MIILAIETSCDDTCVCLYENGKSLSNLVHSKMLRHGIIPENASREHLEFLPKLVDISIKRSNIRIEDVSHIAVTYGPGLLGSLMVGMSYAKGLAFALNKSISYVHHIEAHILSGKYNSHIDFPYGALVVSGGHTLLCIANALGDYSVLGSTLDDSAGECFDKVARVLGLSQPGGPEIEKLAKKGKNRVPLTLPMQNRDGFDFSFSGLKTNAVRSIKEYSAADIACSLQEIVAQHLGSRLKRAIKQYPNITQWVLVGGVAANKRIMEILNQIVPIYAPPIELCTDNALMIAYAASLYNSPSDFSKNVVSRIPLGN